VNSPPEHELLAQQIQRQQELLRQGEAERQRFFQLAPDLFCVATLDGELTRVNPAFYDTLGFAEHELLGRNVSWFVHAEDRLALGSELEQLLDTGKTARFENRWRCKSGEYKWLSWSAVSVPDAGLLYAAARDISEQKQRAGQEALRARHSSLLADVGVLLARSRDMNAILQGCVEALVHHAGAAFARIWLLNEAESMLELKASAGLYTHLDGPHGRVPVGRFKIGLIAEERKPHVTNAVQGDPRVGNQAWAVRENMQAFAGYPLLVGERLVGVIAMFWREQVPAEAFEALERLAENVSVGIRRILAEEEIRLLNQELERRVELRTRELTDVNRELESFSYSVSHDLRAPLRHIAGFAQLLEKQAGPSLDPKAQGYLQTVLEAARRGGQLVDDLLAFSRMGRAELKLAPVDLSALLSEVRRELEPEVGERRVEWRLAELPQARGDAAMLKLVLKNLLSNAVKYSQGREPAVIEVGAEKLPDALHVWVRDNGVGFDMQHADKLFGVFQRLHSPEQFEGTGIGLANVRRIVSRHGGKTWAEATPNLGATFHFTLPHAAPSLSTGEPYR
jgi:PAS domain S-box-containing protein